MIKEICINNTATFKKVNIDNLKKINFFFGSNGSGKTTITRVIANQTNYRDCEIKWKNNPHVKTLVFNEDFVDEYFYNKDVLNGIYTIGEGAKEIEKEIDEKNSKINSLSQDLVELSNKIREKESEKEGFANKLREKCWEKGYLEHKGDFPDFYTGYKSNKDKFKDEVLRKSKCNDSELVERDELINKYNLIYKKDVLKINSLEYLDTEFLNKIKELEENQNILQISIIGLKDVEISKMIENLHIHDWVKQGKEYFDNNYDNEKHAYICPFCQQKTSEDFRKQLEKYFGESFNKNMKNLESYIQQYTEISQNIKNFLNDLLQQNNQYLEEKQSIIQDKIKIIEGAIIQNNQNLIQKGNSPSGKITIEKVYENLTSLNKIIEEINQKIMKHNNIIANEKIEKSNLNSQIWRFIMNELNEDIKNYKKGEDNIGKAIQNLNYKKGEKTEEKEKLTQEINNLEAQIRSVNPTVKSINKKLEGFGFIGFKLAATNDGKHYQIIRNDGSDAKKTLSEGERNFLVFLYFYEMIKGIENLNENINESKILVIDDPVSSFDSNVLFIVATLIKNILDELRKKNDNLIKQIFIFTHNAYFFKEVTFISSGKSCYSERSDTRYYIIRKNNNMSLVDKHEASPIESSYQLLWEDIKKGNIDCISMQNSMRRIIEFYFKFLAGLNHEMLFKKFDDGNDMIICKSLLAWINAGSHEIIDDFNISISNEQISKYQDIFKSIFEYTGHISHYNMMMGITENDKNV